MAGFHLQISLRSPLASGPDPQPGYPEAHRHKPRAKPELKQVYESVVWAIIEEA
jgi:hypothetical protein